MCFFFNFVFLFNFDSAVFFQVDLRHVDEMKGSNIVDIGIDLTEFYTSVEWDILEVPAVRYVTQSNSNRLKIAALNRPMSLVTYLVCDWSLI